MNGNWIELKTKEDEQNFWTWDSSKAILRISAGSPRERVFGTPRPRCQCVVKVSGKVVKR